MNLGWRGRALICTAEWHGRKNKCSVFYRGSWSSSLCILTSFLSFGKSLMLIPNPLNQNVPALLTQLVKE